MTLFGYDVSHYQAGPDIAKFLGDFLIMKCTEGDYLADASYPGWLPSALSTGRPLIVYHFLDTGSTAQAQAAFLSQHIGSRALPVMLDVEPLGSSRPDVGFVLETIDTMRAAGLNVRLVYLPRWYWVELGSPTLAGLTDRNVWLVSSSYPGGPSYPGDNGTGWEPYGPGQPAPQLWQYTDTPIDRNAYRGTITELTNFLEGTDVNLTDTVTVTAGFAARYPDAATDSGFGAGAQIPVSTLLMGSAIRAAHISDLLEKLVAAPAPAPALDVHALAAEIVTDITPHLGTAADADTVAEAVRVKLAAALGTP